MLLLYCKMTLNYENLASQILSKYDQWYISWTRFLSLKLAKYFIFFLKYLGITYMNSFMFLSMSIWESFTSRYGKYCLIIGIVVLWLITFYRFQRKDRLVIPKSIYVKTIIWKLTFQTDCFQNCRMFFINSVLVPDR